MFLVEIARLNLCRLSPSFFASSSRKKYKVRRRIIGAIGVSNIENFEEAAEELLGSDSQSGLIADADSREDLCRKVQDAETS